MRQLVALACALCRTPALLQTAPTSLCAHATVLVHFRVALALSGARIARGRAGFDCQAEDVPFALGSARQRTASCQTKIRAVEIETNAAA